MASVLPLAHAAAAHAHVLLRHGPEMDARALHEHAPLRILLDNSCILIITLSKCYILSSFVSSPHSFFSHFLSLPFTDGCCRRHRLHNASVFPHAHGTHIHTNVNVKRKSPTYHPTKMKISAVILLSALAQTYVPRWTLADCSALAIPVAVDDACVTACGTDDACL